MAGFAEHPFRFLAAHDGLVDVGQHPVKPGKFANLLGGPLPFGNVIDLSLIHI